MFADAQFDYTRRSVAADVVLQRVLTGGRTFSYEQRREQIVNAIEAEMEATFACRETTQSLLRDVGHRGLPHNSLLLTVFIADQREYWTHTKREAASTNSRDFLNTF